MYFLYRFLQITDLKYSNISSLEFLMIDLIAILIS